MSLRLKVGLGAILVLSIILLALLGNQRPLVGGAVNSISGIGDDTLRMIVEHFISTVNNPESKKDLVLSDPNEVEKFSKIQSILPLFGSIFPNCQEIDNETTCTFRLRDDETLYDFYLGFQKKDQLMTDTHEIAVNGFALQVPQ